ncbi:hypothetical protein ACFL46_02290 [Candidatus Neomarinimicrobiota bacterium]
MKTFLKQYKTHIIIWCLILILIVGALYLGVEKKFVLFFTIVLGIFTQAFVGLGAFIATIPFIGPFIVKIFTIPLFWLLNAMGYYVSIIAIKKGYSKEVIRSRVLTTALLVGIVVGYILGNIVPLK